MPPKADILAEPIRHIDITATDVRPTVDAMRHMAFTSRDLARAADIYDAMLADRDCAIILCIAGSMVSAGLKKVFTDLIDNHMVDAIVSTGANIVDQDFFEALGFNHYVAPDEYKSGIHDQALRELMIDRIYDTFIDEEQLRVADDTTKSIFDDLEPRPHTSRELMAVLGKHLDEHGVKGDGRSIIHSAYQRDVPIYIPALNDCSAGFGLVGHQKDRRDAGQPYMTHDGGGDFYELSKIKSLNRTTGLFMIGGGVPKNFAQDITVAADYFDQEPALHKYAIQVTVADVRDGALSSSTLKEACSWGKVDTVHEQMVFSEATLAVPLIAGHAYHNASWKHREGKRLATQV
ncbi:MAG: deoxyhypusine synthase [Planctomycetota bacterium]